MLYHKEIFLPATATALHGKVVELSYTHHAKLALVNDRYFNQTDSSFRPPFIFEINKDNLIEIETNTAGRIVKYVVRLPYDSKFDIALALIPDLSRAVVKTVWLNDRTDTHNSLNKELYAKQ